MNINLIMEQQTAKKNITNPAHFLSTKLFIFFMLLRRL